MRLILIVEDNPKNLKLVRDTLQVKGYQTIETEKVRVAGAAELIFRQGSFAFASAVRRAG